MFDIGRVIAEARIARGLSQAGLAERIGTTQSAVSRWERGHDEPRLRTLDAILRACGRRLVVSSVDPSDNGVDRAQIRQQLAMSPEQRLASVVNVNAFVTAAQRRD